MDEPYRWGYHSVPTSLNFVGRWVDVPLRSPARLDGWVGQRNVLLGLVTDDYVHGFRNYIYFANIPQGCDALLCMLDNPLVFERVAARERERGLNSVSWAVIWVNFLVMRSFPLNMGNADWFSSCLNDDMPLILRNLSR